MWTRFYDMHSGGGAKSQYGTIYIEAPEDRAVEIFEKKFDRHPGHVTCNCCGPDYHYYETEDTVEAVRNNDKKLFITAEDITKEGL